MAGREITTTDVARLFMVEKDLVRKWCNIFGEYLSPGAARRGQRRVFTRADIRVLALIAERKDWWYEEDDGDYSAVYRGLNSVEQWDERYTEIALFATPVFQAPPEEIDEVAPLHCFMIGGEMQRHDLLTIARPFKYAADVLVERAMADERPYMLSYPILYNYRHALELYLKAAAGSGDRIHFLDQLVAQLNKKYGKDLANWAQRFFDQLHEIDPESTTLGYQAETCNNVR